MHGQVPLAGGNLYFNNRASALDASGYKGPFFIATNKEIIPAIHIFGVSPMPSRATARCSCQIPRFDVDLYGRVWVPDCFRFSVSVIDNNANDITRFGQYDNVDSAGPESANPVPEIPMAWVHSVQVSDNFIYMADVINHRVVVCKYVAAVEEMLGL